MGVTKWRGRWKGQVTCQVKFSSHTKWLRNHFRKFQVTRAREEWKKTNESKTSKSCTNTAKAATSAVDKVMNVSHSLCVSVCVCVRRQSEKYKQQQWVETAANSLKEIRPMMLVIVATQQTSTWRLKLLLLLLLRACSWGHAKVSRQPYSRTLSWVQVACEWKSKLTLHSTRKKQKSEGVREWARVQCKLCKWLTFYGPLELWADLTVLATFR